MADSTVSQLSEVIVSHDEQSEHTSTQMVKECLEVLTSSLQNLRSATEEEILSATRRAESISIYVNFCRQLNDLIGDQSKLSESQRANVGAFVCQSLSPYVLCAASASRWQSKPRGYAGDDVSISMIYDQQPSGDSSYDKVIDSLFLSMPAAQAVRNRRLMLASRLEAVYRAIQRKRTVCVMAMAAGPASELFDAWENLGRPTDLHGYLLDGDPLAVESLQQRSEVLRTTGAMTSTKLCAAARKVSLAHVALGRVRLDVPLQDVIYSLGLSDYLKDDLVVKLLNVAYDLLRPGGIVIVGNFHESNPDKACLDHVIQWRLIHRSLADMDRLVTASRFGGPCEEVLRDATGIQMLAVCRKPLACSL